MSPAFVDNDAKFDWRKFGYHARSAFAVILSLVVLLGGGWFVYAKAKEAWVAMRAEEDFIGEGREQIEIVIPQGSSAAAIGNILVENGVIKSAATFRKVARNNPTAKLEAGRWRLRTEIPAKTALDLFQDPNNKVALKVQLKEGQARVQQWQTLSTELGLTQEQLSEALGSPELGLPSWANGNPEGFLFPDTYEVAEPVEALAVLKQQVEQFNKVAGTINLETAAEEVGRTPYEVLITASLVEKEAARPEDRARVAQVVYNRLAADMPLQFDSTVHYAIGDFSRVFTTEEDRATDSPYNTYLHKGLPAGPISNPGEAAIKAALHPETHDYLFFTAVNLETGETKYAVDAAGHEANVQELRTWCSANPGKCK
ncbi:endolytic transglycosylase MltG [Arachnia propionica]|uniref:endolytic transglycosylase MltG n=1 Tax=Arachnia propionica TaxID=1750 RepID=UPI00163A0155|nr:endolytic transglycosylase MltG [Arachnia propionica]MDO5081954.1 endolytic transglycosylase MltG [Arachnia propionica]